MTRIVLALALSIFAVAGPVTADGWSFTLPYLTYPPTDVTPPVAPAPPVQPAGDGKG